jgi:hypothetical protein
MLTGSVIATEAAQVAAKIKGSEAVADTIIGGFFGLIRSEINQQLTELKPKVEALLIEMLQHQESCVLKKKLLESDFARISERYSKIFFDLDKELRNRILLLNQSTVAVHGTLTNRVNRSFSHRSLGITTIYNKEANYLQSTLFASSLKARALSLLENAKKFLFSEKNLSAQLQQILSKHDVGTTVTRQIPVLYFEMRNATVGNEVQIISSEKILGLENNKNTLKNCFSKSGNNWKLLDSKDREQISIFLKIQLEEYQNNNPRIAEQIIRLWEQDTNIQVNS